MTSLNFQIAKMRRATMYLIGSRSGEVRYWKLLLFLKQRTWSLYLNIVSFIQLCCKASWINSWSTIVCSEHFHQFHWFSFLEFLLCLSSCTDRPTKSQNDQSTRMMVSQLGVSYFKSNGMYLQNPSVIILCTFIF